MSEDKKSRALQVRARAATAQLEEESWPSLADTNNGDDQLYARYEASFTKLLHHDADGVLSDAGRAEYERMVGALNRCDADALAEVKLAAALPPPGSARRVLVNPQSAFSFESSGADVAQLDMPAPPRMSSRAAAAELLEVYGNLLMRDVHFDDYKSAHGTAAAVADALTEFGGDYSGPQTAKGNVTPRLLFRGVTEGDRTGPYLSQYLLMPFFPLFPSGCAPFVGGLIGVGNLNLDDLVKPQTYVSPASPADGGQEFLTTGAEFTEAQNGEIPRLYMAKDYESDPRYIKRGRDLGGLVHVDSPYEAYYNALNILVFRGAAGNPAFPYSRSFSGRWISNQADGHTMGPPDVYTLMARACVAAFKAAWANKWLAHRRLRPEVMAARVHHSLKSIADLTSATDRKAWLSDPKKNPYGLHPDLIEKGWSILDAVRKYNLKNNSKSSTLLLPQMYPEGSPGHPAYPSGHATVAGACTTVLKAFFDGGAEMPALAASSNYTGEKGSVRVNAAGTGLNSYSGALTVGGELDKLASNIAHGRDFGGVHYRSDGDEGILLGERVALRLLRDHAATYPELGFKGFELKLRSGVRVRINQEGVEALG